jgi:hypothetical protein
MLLVAVAAAPALQLAEVPVGGGRLPHRARTGRYLLPLRDLLGTGPSSLVDIAVCCALSTLGYRRSASIVSST